jgi:hypothetical protein
VSEQIQIRRGTAANWTSANPILAEGEHGEETDNYVRSPENGDGQVAFKIGDGVTAWNDLPYQAGGSGGGSSNVDGGMADTIYLISQVIDSGGA